MLREATRAFGTPDSLARLGRRLWDRVGARVMVSTKAGKDPRVDRMVAALTRSLLARLDEKAMEELGRGVIHELARAAERSESWTRDSLGLRTLQPWREREGFRKQVSEWTDVEGVFVQEYPELVNEVNGHLETAVGNHAEQVSRTVVNAANPAKPRPIGEVSREIRQQLPGMSVRRSNMIARTETARTYGRTTHQQYARSGIERRRTLTAAGSPAATLSPVCDICIDMAAQGWVGMGDPFESRVSSVSADYAPYHPYCRCDTTGDVEGWLPPMEELPLPDYPTPTTPAQLQSHVQTYLRAERGFQVGKHAVTLTKTSAEWTKIVGVNASRTMGLTKWNPRTRVVRAYLSPSISEGLNSGLAKMSKKLPLNAREARAFETLVHENMHCGVTNYAQLNQLYSTPSFRILEEGMAELSAQRVSQQIYRRAIASETAQLSVPFTYKSETRFVQDLLRLSGPSGPGTARATSDRLLSWKLGTDPGKYTQRIAEDIVTFHGKKQTLVRSIRRSLDATFPGTMNMTIRDIEKLLAS